MAENKKEFMLKITDAEQAAAEKLSVEVFPKLRGSKGHKRSAARGFRGALQYTMEQYAKGEI